MVGYVVVLGGSFRRNGTARTLACCEHSAARAWLGGCWKRRRAERRDRASDGSSWPWWRTTRERSTCMRRPASSRGHPQARAPRPWHLGRRSLHGQAPRRPPRRDSL